MRCGDQDPLGQWGQQVTSLLPRNPSSAVGSPPTWPFRRNPGHPRGWPPGSFSHPEPSSRAPQPTLPLGRPPPAPAPMALSQFPRSLPCPFLGLAYVCEGRVHATGQATTLQVAPSPVRLCQADCSLPPPPLIPAAGTACSQSLWILCWWLPRSRPAGTRVPPGATGKSRSWSSREPFPGWPAARAPHLHEQRRQLGLPSCPRASSLHIPAQGWASGSRHPDRVGTPLCRGELVSAPLDRTVADIDF